VRSLQTLYRKAFKKGPGIMVILDTKHNVSKSVLDRICQRWPRLRSYQGVLNAILVSEQLNYFATLMRAFSLERSWANSLFLV
jgi:hypothetical protein